MNNVIEVDFINECKEYVYTKEDAEMWNYVVFYEEQRELGLDKGYDPNKLYKK